MLGILVLSFSVNGPRVSKFEMIVGEKFCGTILYVHKVDGQLFVGAAQTISALFEPMVFPSLERPSAKQVVIPNNKTRMNFIILQKRCNPV